MLEHTLALLCLDEKDRDIYNLGLEIGAQPASVFSRKIGLKRSDCYNHLKKLMGMGLMTQFDQNGVSYFEIADFKEVASRVEEQNQLVKKAQEEIVTAQRNSAKKNDHSAPKVRFYEGKSGILNLLDRCLRNNVSKVLRCLSAANGFYEVLPSEFDKVYFIPERLRQGIRLKELVPCSPEMLDMKKRDDEENRETRFLDKSLSFSASVMTYDDEILLFGVSEAPFGVLVQSKELAQFFRCVFDMIWNQSKVKHEF